MDFGLGTLFGGIASAIGGASSAALSARAQSRENEKNRKFNAQEAQKNRDYQTEMFHKTNAYNSASQQVQRLMDAGLNPALMYQGSTGIVPASSPSGSQASSGASSAGDFSGIATGFAGLGNALSTNQLTSAQARLANEEARQKEIENKYRDAKESQSLSVGSIQIQLGKSGVDLNNAQIRSLVQQGYVYEQQVKESQARIAQIGVQKSLQEVELRFRNDTYQSQIKLKANELHVSNVYASNFARIVALQNFLTSAQGEAALSASSKSDAEVTKIEQEVARLKKEFANDFEGAAKDLPEGSMARFSYEAMKSFVESGDINLAFLQNKYHIEGNLIYQWMSSFCGLAGDALGGASDGASIVRAIR